MRRIGSACLFRASLRCREESFGPLRSRIRLAPSAFLAGNGTGFGCSSCCRWWRGFCLRVCSGSKYEEAPFYWAEPGVHVSVEAGVAAGAHAACVHTYAQPCLRRARRRLCGALFILDPVRGFPIFRLCVPDVAVPPLVAPAAAAQVV